MRHLFFAAILLLVALVVTMGAATLLENMASNQRPDQDDQPFLPGSTPSAPAPSPMPTPSAPPAGKIPLPEQSRSVSSIIRRT